ncbi:MAG TPA: hypothetical protein PKI44_07055, partial [Candidatus Omnitrophota bacterium]|nr:hypothetical protein [Candidatus Omnitrophota bacterium]
MMKLFYKCKRFCLVILTGMLILAVAGCSKCCSLKQNPPQSYLIAPEVFTTLQRTVVPGAKPAQAIHLDELAKYKQYGYGSWAFGDALKSVTRTDIMPAVYAAAAVTKKAKLLNFFTITDIHITDKESPNQSIYLARLHPALPVA